MDRPELLRQEEVVRKFGKSFLRRDFKLSNGKIIDYYCFGGEIAVIIFPLTQNNEVVGIRQFRYGANEVLIEIPGGVRGKLGSDEAVKKELAEETGYVPKEIHFLGELVWFEPAAVTVPFVPVLATGCEKQKELNFEETEIVEPILVPVGEWVEMIRRGEIRDCKTIAVTFLALNHLSLVSLKI